jgi:hypothetical protein
VIVAGQDDLAEEVSDDDLAEVEDEVEVEVVLVDEERETRPHPNPLLQRGSISL